MTRALGWVTATLFTSCAVVQLNDPDAWVWVAVYGLAAAIGLAFALGRGWWPAAAVLGAGSALWAGSLLLRVVQTLDWTGEEGRESGGLLLVAIGMLALATAELRDRRHAGD